MNILLCTLGASWAVVPEIFGWLAPNVLDLYAHHPRRAELDALLLQYDLRCPNEVWVCTTEGRQTHESLWRLGDWWQRLGAPMPLRVWTAAGTDQLANQRECDHIRELTFRVVLLATERLGAQGQLVLSLAGGRKTMSADLQSAGMLFGAHACLHVVGPDPLPDALSGRTPQAKEGQSTLFVAPLAAELAQAVTPLIAAVGQRNELLDIDLDGRRVTSADFPVPLAEPRLAHAWRLPPEGDALHAELGRRQREGSQLLGNFMARLAETEHHENWRSLYRLPPARIAALRATPLGAKHADWVTSLPKADLHRHVGGCLSLDEQRRVAQAIWADLDDETRRLRAQTVHGLLSIQDWPWDWPQRLQSQGPRRPECAAALLLHASDAQLKRNLFEVTEPRLALKNTERGFAAYERPGELSGSALLSHPAALAPYAQAIVGQARAEGLAYVELRGSPHKYRSNDPLGFLRDLRHALQAAGARTKAESAVDSDADPRIGFIWIIDRRQPTSLAAVVQQAVSAHNVLDGFLLGLDLAGDECTHNPAELAPGFGPAFARCIPLTIHAGEGEHAENIWQAAYHLHADRIGHGLTLARHPQLAARFRDRGICLELCPSSNREVVGFKDPTYPQSASLANYPLREFIDAGLPLTLCTDNPGISRTTISAEYLAAARMCQGGLSLWEALALMRQAFVHAFLPSAERETLIKQVDQRVYGIASSKMDSLATGPGHLPAVCAAATVR